MSQVIAIYWNSDTLHAVVLRQHVIRPELEAVISIPAEAGGSATDIGRRLAQSLAAHASGRAIVVVAVGRAAVTWQHLALPPCPAEDLPDLVWLQASQDSPTAGGDVGFDFLPLSGDDHTAYRVWAVSLAPSELSRIQKICAAADLSPDRIVPLSLGYPAWVGHDPAGSSEHLNIYVSPFAEEATLWATTGGQVVLFRQLQLPDFSDMTTRTSAIAGEIRRTKLALSQQETAAQTLNVQIIDNQQGEVAQLAQGLSTALGEEVRPFSPAKGLPLPHEHPQALLPLAGLALQEAQSNSPPVDLLHPRQRPAPPSRRTTYALLAAALAGLVAQIGWSGYRALNSPLRAAEVAEAEFVELEKSLDDYAEVERQAATIRNWQASAANLLTTIEVLSSTLRPESLTAEVFPADKDTVLERFDLTGRRLTIQGAMRNSSGVPPLESKLRKTATRVRREESSPNQDIPDYPWRYKFVVDVASNQPSAESAAP